MSGKDFVSEQNINDRMDEIARRYGSLEVDDPERDLMFVFSSAFPKEKLCENIKHSLGLRSAVIGGLCSSSAFCLFAFASRRY